MTKIELIKSMFNKPGKAQDIAIHYYMKLTKNQLEIANCAYVFISHSAAKRLLREYYAERFSSHKRMQQQAKAMEKRKQALSNPDDQF